jgi:hypothetical protein
MTVPPDRETALRYVQVYESAKEYCHGFEYGILALEYYMNEGNYEEASRLLRDVIPQLCELSYEWEYTRMFLRDIGGSSALLYQEDAVEEIICRAKYGRSYYFLNTEEVEGLYARGSVRLSRKVDDMDETKDSELRLKEMISVARDMEESKERVTGWKARVEDIIANSPGTNKVNHISLVELKTENAEGDTMERKVLPYVFMSGTMAGFFKKHFCGFWWDCSKEEFIEVFKNITWYGFSCEAGADTVAHAERAACLHVLGLDREYFGEAANIIITIYSVLRPCNDCVGFLETGFCARDLGIEKRKQFLLREERDMPVSFADLLCRKFKCPVRIIVKSLDGAKITVNSSVEL